MCLFALGLYNLWCCKWCYSHDRAILTFYCVSLLLLMYIGELNNYPTRAMSLYVIWVFSAASEFDPGQSYEWRIFYLLLKWFKILSRCASTSYITRSSQTKFDIQASCRCWEITFTKLAPNMHLATQLLHFGSSEPQLCRGISTHDKQRRVCLCTKRCFKTNNIQCNYALKPVVQHAVAALTIRAIINCT